jgi:hypothetical protein
MRRYGSDYTDQGYINLVWRELQKRFGFPLKEWNKRFDDYCRKKNLVDRIEAFYVFGNEVINPILNELLCRRSGYPTFQNLVTYVIAKEPSR